MIPVLTTPPWRDYLRRMKTLLFSLCLVLTLQLSAVTPPILDRSLRLVGRIEVEGQRIRLLHLPQGEAMACVLQNPQLSEVFSKLTPGAEVLVSGHLTYVSTTAEAQTQVHPVLVIESLKTISLRDLGTAESTTPDLEIPLVVSEREYSPSTIPVPAEAAGALTLTASLLLAQSLAAPANENQSQQQLNAGTILIAGLLATAAFIGGQINFPSSRRHGP